MKLKIFFLLLISANCISQVKLSRYEKLWAFFHPFAALKIKKIQPQVLIIYSQKKHVAELDNFSNGGKLDAFRHSFYMAAFAQKVRVKKLRKLGRAHEKGNYKQFKRSLYEEGEVPDSLSSVMDLTNNELGFETGSTNKKTDLETLERIIIEKIKAGEAVIMNRNKKGNYLDCNNKVIELSIAEKKWNVPKCLVASAINYKD